ncbi:RodZ domain-containing protein [Fodinicurvata sediminis]|uniref:RodZ domain-containing protein n=1 Tax=Fodinicurvata sediminis TaxID=1121832 RepID=UPI0003B35246|nr:RodZ domain-containing protein [Fodinicurvata sediminis]
MAQNDGMRGPSAYPEYDDGGWQYYEPGVSDTLRQVRESQELELRDVSKELRIRYDYLLAIEEARYHDLPGTTYAIGFVRSYADYLGLDSDDMVQRFKAEVRDLAAAEQNLSFPAPKPEGRIPGVALVLISVLLIALVYGAWYFWDDQGRPYVELLPGVSEEEGLGAEDGVDSAVSSEEELATTQDFEDGMDDGAQGSLEGENDVSPSAETSESEEPVEGGTERDVAATATQDEAGDSESEVPPAPDSLTEADREESATQEPAQDTTETADLASETQTDDFTTETQDETNALGTGQDIPDTPEDEASPAEVEAESSEQEADGTIPDLPGSEEETDEDTPAETGPGRVYGEDNEGARIVLEATSDSWVQIRDAGGELVFTRVLRAGESYLVPDEEGMTLLTGNAGGLDIRVDGDTIPSLGGMGTVRRDVPLDPQQLSSGALQQ